MSVEIKCPALPESVDSATLMAWSHADGAPVQKDDKLADVETDKVVMEVYAPESGVLRIQKKQGANIRRGDTLAVIEPAGSAPAPAPAAPAAKPAAASVEETAAVLQGLSPSVRRLMQETQVPPAQVKGTGKGGRVTPADVKAAVKAAPAAPAPAPAPAPASASAPAAPEPAPAPAPAPAPGASADSNDGPVRRVPMTQIRQRIASRLKEVQNTAAMLTTFNEVNMKPVMDIRARLQESFSKEHGVKVGFMSFFVKAVAEALKKFPVVNASLDGKDVVYHEYYHIGIAVDSPRGLVVPVLRNADRLTFAGVEKGIRDLAEKARETKLQYQDLTGGTFTITNGGIFGSLLSTPILNAPQSAILGMHAIQNRPIAEGDQVVIRPMMYLALSYDHRLVDGRDAVSFLVAVKHYLEDPAQLLLSL
jgi:2-oxoglutarate dehydrogenase E2 component (dihydrolipoamide succinyltransferase)